MRIRFWKKKKEKLFKIHVGFGGKQIRLWKSVRVKSFYLITSY